MSDSRDVLVTGYPGAVTKGVVARLAGQGDSKRIRLLVDDDRFEGAETYAASLGKNVSVTKGSVHKIDLGLAGEDYLGLASNVSHIVQLDLPRPPGAEPTVDVRGATRELIELALAAEKRPHITFLSHLDVAGDAGGVFAEQDLVLGQRFASDAVFERYRGERILGRFDRDLAVTVVRTGWIVGEGEDTCPLVEILLTQDEETSIPEKVLESKIPFIAAKDVENAVVSLVEQTPGKGEGRWHLRTAGIPKLSDMLEAARSIATRSVGEEIDLEHNAKRYLRRASGAHRWSVKEFLKHIEDGGTIADGRTRHEMEARGITLAHFKGQFPELVEAAVKRIA